MSLYYEHLLIPSSCDFRPTVDEVTCFLRTVISDGYVADNSTIAFAKIKKCEGRTREVRQPFTGETINVRCPSRAIESQNQVANVTEIAALASDEPEYDVSVAAEGIPRRPPCNVGYFDEDAWTSADCPYHLEIRCHVRDHIVRLYSLESEDDLIRPPDFANYRPRFDEDCTSDERNGLFVHPETGAIRIANAGCGKFWIAFKYGKWLFPRLEGNAVELLDNSIIGLARGTFGIEFVEACTWG